MTHPLSLSLSPRTPSRSLLSPSPMRPVLLGREGWRGGVDWWGEESGCGLGVSSFLAFSLLLLFSGQTRRRKGVWDGACVCVSDCVKRHWIPWRACLHHPFYLLSSIIFFFFFYLPLPSSSSFAPVPFFFFLRLHIGEKHTHRHRSVFFLPHPISLFRVVAMMMAMMVRSLGPKKREGGRVPVRSSLGRQGVGLLQGLWLLVQQPCLLPPRPAYRASSVRWSRPPLPPLNPRYFPPPPPPPPPPPQQSPSQSALLMRKEKYPREGGHAFRGNLAEDDPGRRHAPDRDRQTDRWAEAGRA